jgi:cellulose synthase/poly-beta-1,6-N-acetylglucosamine synthase-like glycosyltransferase
MSGNRVDRFPSPAPGPARDDPPSSSFPRRRDAAAEGAAAAPRLRSRLPRENLAPGAGRPLPVEIAFLAAHDVPWVTLQYGAALARRQGVGADRVLIAEGLIGEEAFYRALAAELSVAYLDMPDGLERPMDLRAEAARGYGRFAQNPRGLRWLFAPRGAEIVRLIGVTRSAAGRPLFAITTPTLFEEALRRRSAQALAREAAYSAERAAPRLCVRAALRRAALMEPLLVNALLFAAMASPFAGLGRAASALLALLFLANIALRLAACGASGGEEEDAPALDDAELPTYSVVVALYREAGVAPQLASAIDALDYPRAKLDVKYVVETDDSETADALRATRLRPDREIIVAPPGAPRTKPRALNVAMPFVRGSLVVVFDAEDLPEPDQLRKAAARFARADGTLACLQASLAIHNSDRSRMTALFAIDYAKLFQVFDKGASALGLPFFLGGSSNHFRVERLRAVGCWDAFNVTEDADLGLRLARAGFAAKSFPSKTYEEAPEAFYALLRQRTRWLKGWMQTALVHCSDLPRFFADLGALRGLAVLAIFVGGVVAPLYGPLFSALLLAHALFGDLLKPATPGEAFWSGLWCLVAVSGLGASAYTTVVAMKRERLLALWPALLASPLWSLMLALAAWRALRELWLRPYHWEKTEHRPRLAPRRLERADAPRFFRAEWARLRALSASRRGGDPA